MGILRTIKWKRSRRQKKNVQGSALGFTCCWEHKDNMINDCRRKYGKGREYGFYLTYCDGNIWTLYFLAEDSFICGSYYDGGGITIVTTSCWSVSVIKYIHFWITSPTYFLISNNNRWAFQLNASFWDVL